MASFTNMTCKRHEPWLLPLLAVVAAGVFVCAGNGTRAQDSSPETVVVMVASLEHKPAFDQITEAIFAQVSDLDVAFHVAWTERLSPSPSEQKSRGEVTAGELGADILFGYDPTRPNQLFILLPGYSTPFVTRRLEGAGEGGMAESLAIICRATVRAFLAGEPVAPDDEITPPPPAPALEEPEATPSESPPPEDRSDREFHRLQLTAGYAYLALSTDNPALQGGRIELGIRLIRALSLHLGYSILSPAGGEVEDLELTLRIHPISLGLRLMADVGAVRLGGEAGGALVVATEDVNPRGDMEATGDRTSLGATGVLTGRLEVPVLDWLAFSLAIGIEVLFERVEYVVTTLQGRQTVIKPWRVRPVGMAGISISFL